MQCEHVVAMQTPHVSPYSIEFLGVYGLALHFQNAFTALNHELEHIREPRGENSVKRDEKFQ